MPDWTAALAGSSGATLWDMPAGTGRREVARAALTAESGPVVVAGLGEAARRVPCTPLAETRHSALGRQIVAVPDLRQDNPPARSRGAEIAAAGYLERNAGFDGVLLVRLDRTVWMQVSAGEIVSFQHFLTPALIAALNAPDPVAGPGFDAALSETLSRPDRLAQHLASAEATGSGQQAAHLIGAELASARPWWLGQRVVILGPGAGYAAALAAQGVPVDEADLETALLDGFRMAWRIATT